MTIDITIKAPIKAATNILIEFTLSNPNVYPPKIMRATDKVEPEDTPNIYGSTIGFLKNICNKIPDTARHAPPTMVASTLGILILYIIL